MVYVANAFNNFHWIERGLAARSGQPVVPSFGSTVISHGIRAVINLRGCHPGDSWWDAEAAICRRLNVARFEIGMSARYLPPRERIVMLLDAFETLPRPLLIKCSGGRDRASFAAAIYMLWRYPHGYLKARTQLSLVPYMHFSRCRRRWIRKFLQYAQAETYGRPFGLWVRSTYDVQHFAEWLDSQGLRRSYVGILPRDGILLE